MYNNHSTQDCYIENEMGRMKMRNRQKILTVLAAILFGTLPLTGCQDAGAPEDTKIQQQEEMQEPAISDQESETDSVLEDTEPLEPDTDNDQVLLDPALRQEEQTAETERQPAQMTADLLTASENIYSRTERYRSFTLKEATTGSRYRCRIIRHLMLTV